MAYHEAMVKKAKARGATNGIVALGVMTGTSCDGLDAACVSVDGDGWEPCWAESTPYPAELRKRVLAAQNPGIRLALREVLELHRDLGEWYGAVIRRIIARHDLKPDLIANHGQTIAHFPAAKRKGMTLQAGDPTRVAYLTGLTTVASFRDGDMSAGGQGAPLVPWFHRLLAAHLTEAGQGTAIHNLGGISNLTYIAPDAEVIAFDTGPGNIWIDAAAALATKGRAKFDAGGKLALAGEVDWNAVKKLVQLPYFRKHPPKSTGRDDFPFELLLRATRTRGPSLVATATALTVESVAQAYERLILDADLPLASVHVAGGGARNRVLMGWLASRLDRVGVAVAPLSDSGFDGRWIEAQAFAFFGVLSLLGQPLGGSWTGVKEFAPPGHIIPGENWATLLSKLRAMHPEAFKADSSA
ncbi:MAG: anhydro-N-acetylmuramic acid kinase [Oligoflexia bacterium]|nr:anhydro-N-acetylmuramic acid kinase [Oligoflexia bacterium]